MATKTEDYLGIEDYKVIGSRPIRHDGADKVTGRAVYGADVQFAGLLHGKVLRSPHAHAVIKSIDTSKAEALDGVKAVMTVQDLPELEDKSETPPGKCPGRWESSLPRPCHRGSCGHKPSYCRRGP